MVISAIPQPFSACVCMCGLVCVCEFKEGLYAVACIDACENEQPIPLHSRTEYSRGERESGDGGKEGEEREGERI